MTRTGTDSIGVVWDRIGGGGGAEEARTRHASTGAAAAVVWGGCRNYKKTGTNSEDVARRQRGGQRKTRTPQSCGDVVGGWMQE